MSTANKSSNRWLALMSATLAFTFTFLSRFTWAPLMSTVMEEFSINATQAGLYMSAFFAGYCITQIPGGIMADKLQPKYILIIATLLGGICTALMALIGGYTMGLVVRIVNGLCSGVIMSSCSKIVTANFAPKERATGMGILLASPPIGILLANQIAPRLMHAVGWRGTLPM
ncbi:MAG: MFS transporter [Eubacteriales bacterium]|nr:MFS transporter [Eubacteriales bacterium]